MLENGAMSGFWWQLGAALLKSGTILAVAALVLRRRRGLSSHLRHQILLYSLLVFALVQVVPLATYGRQESGRQLQPAPGNPAVYTFAAAGKFQDVPDGQANPATARPAFQPDAPGWLLAVWIAGATLLAALFSSV